MAARKKKTTKKTRKKVAVKAAKTAAAAPEAPPVRSPGGTPPDLEEVTARLEALTLWEVSHLLGEAILRRKQETD